ncbi:MAG: Gfo/Idh/MocA family protein [Pirellulales bacterium]
MNSVGVGVVGCGFVGRGAHVPAIAEIEDARLVAIADADPKRLKKTTAKYNVPSSYSDYADLVQDSQVDAVIIALPTPLHAKATIAAIEAGKHVLCEMPLAAKLDEADTIIDAAKQKGVTLMPGLTFRFTPNYVKAKEMIDRGVLGAPTALLYREFIPARDLARQWPAGSWVWDVESSGGPLFTLAVWSIDLLRWLTGAEITEVHGSANYTVLDKLGGTLGYDASATLKLANGVVASLQYSGSVTQSASTSVLEVVGDSTSLLRATGNDKLAILGDEPAITEWNVKQPGARMWGHLQQDAHFVRSILDGKTPDITPEDGRLAMEVAQKIAVRS